MRYWNDYRGIYYACFCTVWFDILCRLSASYWSVYW